MNKNNKDKKLEAPVGSVSQGLPLPTPMEGAFSLWVCHCGKEATYKEPKGYFCQEHWEWKY